MSSSPPWIGSSLFVFFIYGQHKQLSSLKAEPNTELTMFYPHQNTIFTDPKPFMSEDVPSKPLTYPSRQPLANHPNGVSRPPQQRHNTFDSQRSSKSNDAEGPGHLVPNRVNILQRKNSDLSAGGSDQDSLLDYYKGQPENRSASRNHSHAATGEKRKPTLGAPWGPEEKDDSNWIHRDKLAQIESRELEEAGIRVGRTSRSGSRSASTTIVTRERSHSENHEDAVNVEDHTSNQYEKRQRMVSPIPAEEEEEEVDEGPVNWDPRTPEEIAADQEKDNHAPRYHMLKSSTSRIPIAKTSPVPVPHTFVERDSPLPRSRKGSGAWNGDTIATNGARARSVSVGSQVLLDDAEDVGARTPVRSEHSNPASPSGSPPKSKVPGKANPTSGARKTSTARAPSQKKARNASATSPVKRPGTSSGISRPTTARPEGEAPWIATMYKPDPRLPPDQQIVPTHAKRMQQEQWENEGRTGSMYDRDFRLLNTEEFNKPEIETKEFEPSERKEQDTDQWPLPSPKPETATGKPGTSGGEQGAYKLTPTIQSPQLPSQRNSVTRPEASSKPANTTRVQEPPESNEKKSCGCCIVM